jgi:hypothetical protein
MSGKPTLGASNWQTERDSSTTTFRARHARREALRQRRIFAATLKFCWCLALEILRQIEAKTGFAGLADVLGHDLPPSDLQSLMLTVYRARARSVNEARLMARGKILLCAPSNMDARILNSFERIAFSRNRYQQLHAAFPPLRDELRWSRYGIARLRDPTLGRTGSLLPRTISRSECGRFPHAAPSR